MHRSARHVATAAAVPVTAVAALVLSAVMGYGAARSAVPAAELPAAAPASAPAAAAGPAATGGASGSVGILTLDWGDLDSTSGAWRGNYVVIQPWEGDRIAGLKAKNPGLTVLMYKDVSATVKDACSDAACTKDDEILPTGVGYHWASQHHPGWFLQDEQGRRLEWSDWPGLYPMDVGQVGYQDRWAGNVLAELRAHDWDGVMLDDVLTELSHSVYSDRVSTVIADDGAMYAATESFLARVGPALEGAGFLAVGNVGFQWDDWRAVLEDWTPYVTGWENEYFVKWGLSDDQGPVRGADWRWKMKMAAWCAKRDVPLLAVTYSTSTDLRVQVYHRATWLLTWNGRTGASIFVPEEEFTNHWLPAPTAEIGRPVGPRRRDADTGVYRREFTRGVALVNPTGTKSRVALRGTYRTLGGKAVTSVRIGPAHAVILRK